MAEALNENKVLKRRLAAGGRGGGGGGAGVAGSGVSGGPKVRVSGGGGPGYRGPTFRALRGGGGGRGSAVKSGGGGRERDGGGVGYSSSGGEDEGDGWGDDSEMEADHDHYHDYEREAGGFIPPHQDVLTVRDFQDDDLIAEAAAATAQPGSLSMSPESFAAVNFSGGGGAAGGSGGAASGQKVPIVAGLWLTHPTHPTVS